MLPLALNPRYRVRDRRSTPIQWVVTAQTSIKGFKVTTSLRRRIVALLALVVGFGVVSGTASASASPAASQSSSVSVTSAQTSTMQAADWWW
jgi:hypothetical protein